MPHFAFNHGLLHGPGWTGEPRPMGLIWQITPAVTLKGSVSRTGGELTNSTKCSIHLHRRWTAKINVGSNLALMQAEVSLSGVKVARLEAVISVALAMRLPHLPLATAGFICWNDLGRVFSQGHPGSSEGKRGRFTVRRSSAELRRCCYQETFPGSGVTKSAAETCLRLHHHRQLPGGAEAIQHTQRDGESERLPGQGWSHLWN